MMSESTAVMRNENRNKYINHDSLDDPDCTPFTIYDRVLDDPTSNKISWYELMVTVIIMLNTISGGFLEGYSSAAIPYMLMKNITTLNMTKDNNLNKTRVFPHSDYSNAAKLQKFEQNDINLNIRVKRNLENENLLDSITENETKLSNFTAKNLEENSKDLFTTEANFLNLTSMISSESDGDSLMKTSTEQNFEISRFTDIPATTSTSKQDFQSSKNFPVKNQTDFLNITTNSTNMIQASWVGSITKEQGSWVGSLLILGAALGSLLSSYAIQYGRRNAIIISAVPRIIGWVLIWSASSVSYIYIGRLLNGISIGAVSSAAPIYISEISHPSSRGILVSMVLLGVSFGMFLASFAGIFLDWRGLAIFGGVTVILYFFPSLFIPSSPSWLLWKGNNIEAKASLRKLRKGRSYPIDDEFCQLNDSVSDKFENQSITWKNLFLERRSRWPLLILLLLTVVNRCSGYNAIITYCTLFIESLVPIVSEYTAAVMVCLIQIVSTLVSIKLVDSWGRRKLLLTSVIIMAVSLLSITILEAIVPEYTGGWMIVLATMFYIAGYSFGIGPLTWVLLGELFPIDARGKASALISFTNWILAFLVTKTYFDMEHLIGVGLICLIYSSVCIFGGIGIYFLVPETKGKSLSEIESHFSYDGIDMKNLREFDRSMCDIITSDNVDSYSTFY